MGTSKIDHVQLLCLDR